MSVTWRMKPYRGYKIEVDKDGKFRAYEWRSGREVQKPSRILTEVANSNTLWELRNKVDRRIEHFELVLKGRVEGDGEDEK